MKIRKMECGDLEHILFLAHSEGWISDLNEFSLILQSNPMGCFTAEVCHQVIGAVMSVKYGQSAWVGNLIVDKGYRKLGIGSKLLGCTIQHLESDDSIKSIYLNAAHDAVCLYTRFGFVRSGEVLRWLKNNNTRGDHASQSTDKVSALKNKKCIMKIDKNCWGDDRSSLFGKLINERKCVMIEDGPAFLMYYSLKTGTKDLQVIGPWEVENGSERIASNLLEESLSRMEGSSVVLDVPAENKVAREVLSKAGFGVIGSTVFMYRKNLQDIKFEDIFGFMSMGSMG
ncbi:GNAT family N-acetyltransferase [Methanococcoides sp. FTZ1]|uniref:GNAT family N-acetyltransferase n=1 Tax=Methanococcoides sp. FTZ1 TaxID=3439061 RepID=UPI003F866A5E